MAWEKRRAGSWRGIVGSAVTQCEGGNAKYNLCEEQEEAMGKRERVGEMMMDREG